MPACTWRGTRHGGLTHQTRRVHSPNTPCLLSKYAVFTHQIRRVYSPNTPCLLAGQMRNTFHYGVSRGVFLAKTPLFPCRLPGGRTPCHRLTQGNVSGAGKLHDDESNTTHTRNATRTLTRVGLRNGMRNIMDTKVIRRLTRNQGGDAACNTSSASLKEPCMAPLSEQLVLPEQKRVLRSPVLFTTL